MKKFFDWMVRGFEQAADRAANKREAENREREYAAEKRGLKEAYDRQSQALQLQLKKFKDENEQLQARLAQINSLMTPVEVAKKMKEEQMGYSENSGCSASVIISDKLKAAIMAAGEMHSISHRQILTGMVALTWPDKLL